MKRNITKIILGTAILTLTFGTASFAGRTYVYYNEIVGRFNGSGYSAYQTKVIDVASGHIKSEKVGGNYVVDVRMQGSVGNGKWVRDLDDGSDCLLPATSKMVKGCKVRMQFSNDWNTPVAVQVYGDWKSN